MDARNSLTRRLADRRLSPSLLFAGGLSALALCLVAAGRTLWSELKTLFSDSLVTAALTAPGEVGQVVEQNLRMGLWWSLVLTSVILIGVMLGRLAQGPTFIDWSRLRPRFRRISLENGFVLLRDALSSKHLVVGLVAIAAPILIGLGILWRYRLSLPAIVSADSQSILVATAAVLELATAAIAIGVVLIGLSDWVLRRGYRQTKAGARSPAAAAREYVRRRAQIRRPSLRESVLQSRFTLTDAASAAVLIAYDPERTPYPIAVLTGEGRLARFIEDQSREAGRPVVRETALTRALVSLEPGSYIPARHYEKLAEVLAIVYEDTPDSEVAPGG